MLGRATQPGTPLAPAGERGRRLTPRPLRESGLVVRGPSNTVELPWCSLACLVGGNRLPWRGESGGESRVGHVGTDKV